MLTGRWVSCARDVEYRTSLTRHFLPSGSDTTLCNATGSGGAWRGNTTKPACVMCERLAPRHPRTDDNEETRE